MKIDINKPIVEAATGKLATLLASGITGAIPGVKSRYIGGETLLIQGPDPVDVFYIYEDGRKFRNCSDPAFRNGAERRTEFFNIYTGIDDLGASWTSLAAARGGSPTEQPVIEVVTEGSKVVDVKFHAVA